ncbi:class II fructose-1,6-bisphosphate aldolase [Biomaibacter acetigenes]|uniref:Class II fructose-1,6-bisphosphate aldolase n=1 Tax=Biomaibacter acetigenes TaxID=2316383 RepID=A0A3G2R7F1_9FIRM|nr:class II fructose-1,6-bisphosphate aldolase [Biomaibacter acetigenes]AYO31339.1 class II fructose-1,6-bisphosphate aldolase [Biomaibacter acetigenes]
MPLVSSKIMLTAAQRGHYAIAAFNIHNLETLKAVVETAREERAPVILQATPGTCRHAGVNFLHAMAKTAALEADIPIALHLDHGDDVELAFKCIDGGFTSIMVDGSKLPFEQNVEMVRKVIDYARPRGVQVEAELGRVGGVEEELSVSEYEAAMTEPEKAAEYVERTGVDSLAVAIGTAHGMYKGEPKLDFERLEKIKNLVAVPLVLHGCSGVPDDMVKKAITLGICKINIATDIKIAFAGALLDYFKDNPKEVDPRKYFKPAQDAVKDVVKSKIRLAGSCDKAV